MEYEKATKGHRGFLAKYKVLGKTKNTRIPISITPRIRELIDKLEIAGRETGMKDVERILDFILKGFDKI